MKIICNEEEDLMTHGFMTDFRAFRIHVQIDDIRGRADEMTSTILDNSWISRLDEEILQVSYKRRAAKTIEKIINNILNKVDTDVTKDFGEYLVSMTAGTVLEKEHYHKKLALAELWKEKLSTNPGFDFHTEHEEFIFFGEAKYKSIGTPSTTALKQVVSFIEDEKEIIELADLKNFCNKKSAENTVNGLKGYVIAFSLRAENPEMVFNNLFKSKYFKDLVHHAKIKKTKIFVIGIEIA